MNMIYWLIPLITLGLSVLVIVVMLIRAIPKLVVIDVETIPKERSRKIKEQIIMKRFVRMRNEKVGKFAKAAQGVVKETSRWGRRAVQKLYKLEQQYKKLQQTAGAGMKVLDDDTVKRLIDEAEDLIRQDEFIPAEKKYIEVISHNPKNIDAYEGLGNLYLKSKSYGQARETLSFALKISPDDASVHMSMAELEIHEENNRAALNHLRKCYEKRPKNPKYLDMYLEVALDEKSFDDASIALNVLREVNPENTKIPEWEERLMDLMGAIPSQEV